jgi:hypothetical protein
MEGEINTIEDLAILMKQTMASKEDIKEVKEDIQELHEEMNECFEKVDVRLDHLDARVGRMEADIHELRGEIVYLHEFRTRCHELNILRRNSALRAASNACRTISLSPTAPVWITSHWTNAGLGVCWRSGQAEPKGTSARTYIVHR